MSAAPSAFGYLSRYAPTSKFRFEINQFESTHTDLSARHVGIAAIKPVGENDGSHARYFWAMIVFRNQLPGSVTSLTCIISADNADPHPANVATKPVEPSTDTIKERS